MTQHRDNYFSQWIKSFLMMGSCTLLISTSVYALPSDRNQPISLEADRATFNEKTGITTYTGNVVIQQGTLKVSANSIVANLTSDNKIKTITAQGSPAKFQQQIDAKSGVARGEGKKIVYNAETGIINLTGNGYLYQNGASFRGENLVYSMTKGDIQADGGNKGRIQIIIPPSAQQSFSGVKD